MLPKYFSILVLIMFIVGVYFGKAREAVVMLWPVIIGINYFKLRAAHAVGDLPNDLKFIANFRGDREAFLWGYLILGVMAIFWLLTLASLIFGVDSL